MTADIKMKPTSAMEPTTMYTIGTPEISPPKLAAMADWQRGGCSPPPAASCAAVRRGRAVVTKAEQQGQFETSRLLLSFQSES